MDEQYYMSIPYRIEVVEDKERCFEIAGTSTSHNSAITFCEACGRALIKRGNRQKYCGTDLCQSIRNNRKSILLLPKEKRGEENQYTLIC